MIRNGMRIRLQRQLEQERQARAEQTQTALLQQRWKTFSLPVQAELQSHLDRFGVVAADHATFLVERVSQERKSTS